MTHLKALVMTGLLIATGSTAEAGLRGRTLEGTFTNSNGVTAGSCMRFNEDGTIDWDQRFDGSSPVLFTGTYSEFDLVIVSLWSAEFPQGDMTGIGILGMFSSCDFTSTAIPGLTFEGFYHVFTNCEPGVAAAAAAAILGAP